MVDPRVTVRRLLVLALLSGVGACDSGQLGGASGIPPETEDFQLIDDFDSFSGWSWSGQIGGMPLDFVLPVAATTPARTGSATAAHIDLAVSSAGADVYAHNHYDFEQAYRGLRFWARRGPAGPQELVVSLAALSAGSNYLDALAAGKVWKVRRIPLAQDWQQFRVNWTELAPEFSGDIQPAYSDQGGMGSAVHFIVEPNQPVDLWLDDVELVCAAGACPG
jgi:hypothetical protein